MNAKRMPASDGLRVLHLGVRMAEVTVYTDNFCRGFAERHRSAACSFYPREPGFPDHVAAYPGDGTMRGFASAIRRAIEDHKPDVIHSHYPHMTFLLLAWRRLSGRRDRTPLVQTVQNSFDNYSLRNRVLWRLIYSSADRIVHCGQAAHDSFPSRLRASAKSQPLSIPNAVDIGYVDKQATPGHRFREPGEPLRVGYVGRLIECKNVELLIHAAALRKDLPVRFTVIGDGDRRDSLIALAGQLGVADHFEFTGRLDLDDVYRRVSQLDAIVHPSRGEGLPRSVLEAMALRRPLLLSDIGPHRDISDGKDIPLFDANSAEQLSALLRDYSELSAGELRDRGERCRDIVERHFSVEVMHDRYTEVYESLIGGGACSAAAA